MTNEQIAQMIGDTIIRHVVDDGTVLEFPPDYSHDTDAALGVLKWMNEKTSSKIFCLRHSQEGFTGWICDVSLESWGRYEYETSYSANTPAAAIVSAFEAEFGGEHV